MYSTLPATIQWKWQMLETMSFKYMLFWKLLYFHNINVDNFWHTFQLPLEKILAQGIQNRLIFKSKIRDILRYLEDLSRYLEKLLGYVDIFLRTSSNIFRRFHIFVSRPSYQSGCERESPTPYCNSNRAKHFRLPE